MTGSPARPAERGAASAVAARPFQASGALSGAWRKTDGVS